MSEIDLYSELAAMRGEDKMAKTPRVDALKKKFTADWNGRILPTAEAGALAAKHCDEAMKLASEMEQEGNYVSHGSMSVGGLQLMNEGETIVVFDGKVQRVLATADIEAAIKRLLQGGQRGKAKGSKA